MSSPDTPFIPVEVAIKKSLPLVRAGELWKKGRSRHNWTKRWFQLRLHSLAYYTNRKVRPLLFFIII